MSGDTDAAGDIYERSGGMTTLVTQGQINGNGPFGTDLQGVSADGSRVFFHTYEQLVSGDTDGFEDVYECSGGTTTWVSQGEIGGSGDFQADFQRASSDGSRAFFDTSEQLVSGDTDNSLDVYEHSGGTTTLVSQGQINGNGPFGTDLQGVSADGSRVFIGTSEQLVSGDTDSSFDCYERSGGTTTLVSQGRSTVTARSTPAAAVRRATV